MTKVIGCSLSLCLRKIVAGEVALDDVEFIIANTAYSSAEQMEAALRPTMSPGPAADEMIKAAHILWNSGRIYQATVRDTSRMRTGPLWAAAPGFYEDRIPQLAA